MSKLDSATSIDTPATDDGSIPCDALSTKPAKAAKKASNVEGSVDGTVLSSDQRVVRDAKKEEYRANTKERKLSRSKQRDSKQKFAQSDD